MPIVGIIIFSIIALIILILIVRNIKIVPQAHAFVIERLGAYHTTWETGLHLKVPFIDRISRKVSLKEQVVDFPPSTPTALNVRSARLRTSPLQL